MLLSAGNARAILFASACSLLPCRLRHFVPPLCPGTQREQESKVPHLPTRVEFAQLQTALVFYPYVRKVRRIVREQRCGIRMRAFQQDPCLESESCRVGKRSIPLFATGWRHPSRSSASLPSSVPETLELGAARLQPDHAPSQ